MPGIQLVKHTMKLLLWKWILVLCFWIIEHSMQHYQQRVKEQRMVCSSSELRDLNKFIAVVRWEKTMSVNWKLYILLTNSVSAMRLTQYIGLLYTIPFCYSFFWIVAYNTVHNYIVPTYRPLFSLKTHQPISSFAVSSHRISNPITQPTASETYPSIISSQQL